MVAASPRTFLPATDKVRMESFKNHGNNSMYPMPYHPTHLENCWGRVVNGIFMGIMYAGLDYLFCLC